MAEPHPFPRSNGSDASGGAARRRPSLRIDGEIFVWDWVPGWARCVGCGSSFPGEGYGGRDRDSWRESTRGTAPPVLVFCETCGLRRAQGSGGTAVIDGEVRPCRVRRWDRTDPENLAVLLDDEPAVARRERDRLIVRRVPVETFNPERGR